MEDFGLLLQHARPYRRRLLAVGALMVLNSAAMLTVPWLLGTVAGGFASDMHFSKLVVPALLASLLVIALLNAAVAYVGGNTGSMIVADLREKIYRHLQSLPIGFHRGHRQGDILALMTRETNELGVFLSHTVVSIIPLLITAAGATFLMFRIDWRTALAIPVLLPVFFVILRSMRLPMREIARSLREAEADVMAAARQNLDILPMLKAFTREDATARAFDRLVGRALDLACREHRIYALVEPLTGFLAASAAVILLVVLGNGVAAGSMSTQEMLSFLLYAALLTRPAGDLARLYGEVQRAQGALARMHEVLNEPHEAGYLPTGHLRLTRAEIRFSGLHFAYPGREEVLRGVDLLIGGGETVAISGHNGAGKSSMVSLLLRYYEPLGGSIAIDGQDIAGINVKDLRRHIGLVSQEVILFNGTVRENIAYGLEGATTAQVEAAAAAALADEFIAQLPQGYETQIGDAGIKLSGGQRQRIALARALLKDPPIMILDEANSMYDLKGEAAFVAACRQNLKGRTTILISHREATLALADRIVRLENGTIHEVRG